MPAKARDIGRKEEEGKKREREHSFPSQCTQASEQREKADMLAVSEAVTKRSACVRRGEGDLYSSLHRGVLSFPVVIDSLSAFNLSVCVVGGEGGGG